MTEPGGVGTPETEAGRAYVENLFTALSAYRRPRAAVVKDILAIEAEATRAERERIVRAVGEMRIGLGSDANCDCECHTAGSDMSPDECDECTGLAEDDRATLRRAFLAIVDPL